MNLLSILFSFYGKSEKSTKEVQHSFPDIDSVSRYFYNEEPTTGSNRISDKVWSDLDGDDLFVFADHTHSCPGKQLLYQSLRTLDKKNFITENEELIRYFDNNNWQMPIEKELTCLSHHDAYELASLFQQTQEVPSKTMQQLYRVCQLLPFALAALFLISNQTITLLLLLTAVILNVVLHYKHKYRLWRYLHAFPQFLTLLKVAFRLYKDSDLSRLSPDLGRHIQALKPLKRELQLFQLDTKLDSDAAIIVYVLIEILRIFFLLEPNALTKATNLLNSRQEDVEAVFLFVGKVDVLCSMATLRKDLPYYCRPESAEPKIIETKAIYHPLIPDCISNDFSNGHKSVILTGSNMSGKTAFIRTIAINMLTAQTLNLCFAKTFRAQPMPLFSSIHINDDLMNAKSYYLQEVLTVKEMIDASENGYPVLFLLDELFKGTNTTERIAAGKAILSALNSGNNIVLMATHDLELAELLHDEFDLYHFSEQIEQKELTFDYKLKSGIMTHRNAIRILELYGYPVSTVHEAYEIAGGNVQALVHKIRGLKLRQS
ncbi:MAG: mismatch repair protein MutS domain protein [Bacteroidetes bacterium]|nr:mismatch repair protein MutS domain protein [Bacteroidota bacterium]